jgi:hypothetical protein
MSLMSRVGTEANIPSCRSVNVQNGLMAWNVCLSLLQVVSFIASRSISTVAKDHAISTMQ